APVNGSCPGAGPGSAPGGGSGPAGVGGPGGATSSSEVAAALEYAKSHGTARVALVVQNDEEAAPYVIDGQSIASMGGFTGRETVVSRATLARLVSSGDARHFLLGSGGYTGLVRSNAGVAPI